MTTPTSPAYDRSGLTTGIVHFGIGNFHRSHQAMYVDRLLEAGDGDGWAICGVGLFPGDKAMRDDLAAQDFTYTLVLRDSREPLEARTIGSIVDFVYAPDDPDALVERLASPETRIVSLTITEGGYGEHPDPSGTPTAFDYIVDALALRRERGTEPFTVVSCDNIESNGVVARRSVLGHAYARGGDLAGWIEDNVAFPGSMVDRITPVTTDEDRAMVERELGVQDRRPVVGEPFVQWVLEDRFPAGRPDLGSVGVQLVDDVVPYERMKLRILNATHQLLGFTGLLAGHRYVHEAATDDVLGRLAAAYIADEARPTVGEVEGIDLADYQDTILERFGNEAIADTLVRIATDGSDRIHKFVVPVVEDLIAQDLPVRATAFTLAASAVVAGTPELTEQVTDRQRDRLDAAAERLGADTGTYLDDEDLFGRIGADARFREAFVAAHDAIVADGVLAAAQALLDGTGDA
ncbi:mannitol dehydrogenase family protein [Georgenia sp. Z1491]|uniref:mannitol dehydrogenase family protein n=1 Tax=Georgenia sp. Z1491 TaxID=3416707 RepID=UPI003CE8014A